MDTVQQAGHEFFNGLRKPKARVQKTFDYLTDPGHGWVKVPKTLISDLLIREEISHYSYMRGAYAYLEEDCDASKFHEAYEKCFGFPPKYRERNAGQKQSRVRGYAQYDDKNLWNPQFDK